MISFEIIIIAFALAMDAFAVAASAGMVSRGNAYRTALVYGIFFGMFQFLMALAGYILHMVVPGSLLAYSHLIAFALLFIIGAGMIYGSFAKCEERDKPCANKPLAIPELFALSFATSIDALAAGTSLALIEVNILSAATTIGVVAFVLSVSGVLLGRKASGLLSHSGLIGGVVIVAIAIHILIS